MKLIIIGCPGSGRTGNYSLPPVSVTGLENKIEKHSTPVLKVTGASKERGSHLELSVGKTTNFRVDCSPGETKILSQAVETRAKDSLNVVGKPSISKVEVRPTKKGQK